MRKRYFTSHKKLSIIAFIFLTIVSNAKNETEDTNIICFAAKNQWVCAPEDEQEIANDKANKLINNGSEQEISQVIIKSINFPKFNPQDNTQSQIPSEVSQIKIEAEVEQPRNERKPSKSASNPYAKLWSHQLIGVSTPQNAINFVKKHYLNKDDILIIKSKRNGMDWWIILYGLYKDKQTGLNNALNLPKNIDDYWLRPLKNLQVNGFIEKF